MTHTGDKDGYHYGVSIQNSKLDGLGAELEATFVKAYDIPEMMTVTYFDSESEQKKLIASNYLDSINMSLNKLINDKTLIEGSNPAPTK